MLDEGDRPVPHPFGGSRDAAGCEWSAPSLSNSDRPEHRQLYRLWRPRPKARCGALGRLRGL